MSNEIEDNNNFLKKNKKKIIIIIVLIIVLLIIISTLRKFIILTNINKLANESLNKYNNNLHLHVLQITNSNIVTESDYYYKDGKIYIEAIKQDGLDILYARYFGNDDELVVYYNDSEEEEIVTNKEEILNNGLRNYFENVSIKDRFFNSFKYKIKDEEYHGNNVYFIDIGYGSKLYISKDNGLLFKYDGYSFENEYSYYFNENIDDSIFKISI